MDDAGRKRGEQQYFDRKALGESPYALKYDQVYLDYLTELAVSRVGAPKDGTVLVYGCGTGADLFRPLLERGTRTVMIDLSFESVKMQAGRLRERGEVIECVVLQMDCEHLGLRRQTVDGVLGRAILHHLALDAAAREITRVLKPGGRAVFVEPLNGNPAINLFRRLTPAWRTPTEHPLSFGDMVGLRRYFAKVTHVEVGLTAAAGLALNALLQRLSLSPVNIRPLLTLDKVLLSRIPWLGRFCWSSVITLEM